MGFQIYDHFHRNEYFFSFIDKTFIFFSYPFYSFIFVELGTPLKETEHLIHFYLYLVTTAQSAGQKKKFELLGSYPVGKLP